MNHPQDMNSIADSLLKDNPLIVIASNRGPFTFNAKRDGTFAHKRGAGGLVTALGALAEEHDVLWVASALNRGDHLWARKHQGVPQSVEGIRLKLIPPDNKKQYRQYYNVISNPLLWFIQHQLWDIPRQPSISAEIREAWDQGYVTTNDRFAAVIASLIEETDRPVIVFPQDYHLYLVPHFLRKRLGKQVHIQPFIHIPWPGPDAWRILPDQMRSAILRSLLMSDRIGFQTESDAFNFVQTCRFYLRDAHARGTRNMIHYLEHKVEVQAYPISIDVEKVQAIAQEPETRKLEKQIRSFAGDRQLILRIDRVEPSKNILRGLEAYRTLLEKYPEHRGKVQLFALLVPSRMEVDEYQTYLRDIMAESGWINARFGDGKWEPVRILLGDNYPRAIAAMRLYDVLLVNPIADGMNLVAKEGVLVNQNNGVLVLSEHAGAFYELGEDALSISPFDSYGTAEALHQGLVMSHEQRHERAERLRAKVQQADVRRWFYQQLEDALQAVSSHSKKSSTPETPATVMSAERVTASGVADDKTPIPNA